MSSNLTSYDNILHDPLDSFADREQILSYFEHFLRSAQPGQFRLLAIKGNSGTGKTFLISYLTNRICPQLEWQSGQMSFFQSRPDFRTILVGLEYALRDCVPSESLQNYRAERDKYNRRFDEYRASITIHQNVEAKDFSSISGVTQNVQVNAELREREMQLRSELSRALIELAEDSQHPLCLFIDGYERLVEVDPELIGWLWEEVLLGLVKAAPKPILVVTCGWESPSNATIKPFSYLTDLTDFDVTQVRSYLEKQGVITAATSISVEHQELTAAFYELTKGHPLVLGLAVTYFNQLSTQERTAKSLQANRLLIDERARVEFLEERLLSRLPEPHRSLLERGPLLRYIDQATLQVLLAISANDTKTRADKLDDRAYSRFLQYPFINQVSASDQDPSIVQPVFHELVRRVRLEALRHHHPQTKELLHHKIADYYRQMAGIESARQIFAKEDNRSPKEIPEKEFSALLEYFYHALQVAEIQTIVFEEWSSLTGRTITAWERRLAESLLQIVRQLEAEGELFLRKTGIPYGRYLLWYSKLLSIDAHWEEALDVLNLAMQLTEQVDTPPGSRTVLDELVLNKTEAPLEESGERQQEHSVPQQSAIPSGWMVSADLPPMYSAGGVFANEIVEMALNYFERARIVSERLGNPADFDEAFDDMSLIYEVGGVTYYGRLSSLRERTKPANMARNLKRLAEALQKRGAQSDVILDSYKQASVLFEQIGDLVNAVHCLNEIASIYASSRNMRQVLYYYEQTLPLYEQMGDLSALAGRLNNIGYLYYAYRAFDQALSYYKRALAFSEQEANPVHIATCFNNMGLLYSSQGQLEEALDYYKQAIPLSEQAGDFAGLAIALDNMGSIYYEQQKLEEALDYCKRALTLFEQGDNLTDTAICFSRIGDIYRDRGEFGQALSYYERALAIEEQGDNPVGIAQSLNEIGSIYYAQGRLEEALKYLQRALPLYEQTDDLTSIAQCLHNMGDIYYAQSNIEQASACFERSLSFYKQIGDQPKVAQLLNNIGTLYYNQGKLEQALIYLEEALAFIEQMNDPTTLATCLHNIGHIYRQQRNWTKALAYFERALPLFEQKDNAHDLADCLYNIGFSYLMKSKWEQALDYLERALPFFERMGSLRDIVNSLNFMSYACSALGKLEEASNYTERVLATFSRKPVFTSEDRRLHAIFLYNAGSIYFQQKNFAPAIERYVQSLTLLESLGGDSETDLVRVLEGLSDCYDRLGEHTKSLAYQERAQQIREDIQKTT